MEERLIIAGAGGQGIMLMGKLLALAAMNEDLHVTWFPSYGAEVRGGTAHCHMVLSDTEVYSPLVEKAGTLVILNEPSLVRFETRLAPWGTLVLNTSLAEPPTGLDGRILAVPATDIANELGNIRVANMVMLAALNAAKRLVKDETLWGAVEEFAGAGRADLLEVNRKAYERGLEIGRA
jgi:2-oxoglutarate ferredoxin oxidoreductase subunit gamma